MKRWNMNTSERIERGYFKRLGVWDEYIHTTIYGIGK